MINWYGSDKPLYSFNYSTYNYAAKNNRTDCPFYRELWSYRWDFISNCGFICTKADLTKVIKNEVKVIQPDSRLYFDSGSTFPRFKLGLSNNKRCIKIEKADIIVVSGESNYEISSNQYAVLEDDAGIYLVRDTDWNQFGNSLCRFLSAVKGFVPFTDDVKFIYFGKLMSFAKDSEYLAKYAFGDYTLPYITDKNLDNVICAMCPEPTYEEIISLKDMLHSDDAAIVQLGIKTLATFNVTKYKMAFRLLLYTDPRWFDFTKNTVSTKQLIETLSIDNRRICNLSYNNNFSYTCDRVILPGETFTTEDVALSKKLSRVLIEEWLQNMYDRVRGNNYSWLPDERKVSVG